MIISISGKAGHGKDTLGKMIQYWWEINKSTSNMGTVYWANSSVEEFLSNEYLQRNTHWDIKKFAGKLKEIATMLTGIPIEKFEDQEFKKTYLGREWSSPVLGSDWVKGVYNQTSLMTVRDFLQKLGTDAMRFGLHQDVWVNALYADYNPITYSDRGGWEYPDWIITDMRFDNEAEAGKKRDGISIRVTNPNIPAVEGEHISERLLDNYTGFDFHIVNTGNCKELYQEVDKLCKQIFKEKQNRLWI